MSTFHGNASGGEGERHVGVTICIGGNRLFAFSAFARRHTRGRRCLRLYSLGLLATRTCNNERNGYQNRGAFEGSKEHTRGAPESSLSECGRLSLPLAALVGLPLRALVLATAARGVSSSEEVDMARSAADGGRSKEQPDFVARTDSSHLFTDGSASLARKSQKNPRCTPVVDKCSQNTFSPLCRRANRSGATFWERCLASSGGALSKVAGDIHGDAFQVYIRCS